MSEDGTFQNFTEFMKNLIISLFLLMYVAVSFGTITTTNTLSPTTLAGTPALTVTNYSAPVVVGYVGFRYNPNFVINQAGLNTTNSFTNYTILSLTTNVGDPAGWFNNSTNLFAVTNQGSLTIPLSGTVPVYGWTQTIVTNSTVVWQSAITTTP
jgi:hypothetical protein